MKAEVHLNRDRKWNWHPPFESRSKAIAADCLYSFLVEPVAHRPQNVNVFRYASFIHDHLKKNSSLLSGILSFAPMKKDGG